MAKKTNWLGWGKDEGEATPAQWDVWVQACRLCKLCICLPRTMVTWVGCNGTGKNKAHRSILVLEDTEVQRSKVIHLGIERQQVMMGGWGRTELSTVTPKLCLVLWGAHPYWFSSTSVLVCLCIKYWNRCNSPSHLLVIMKMDAMPGRIRSKQRQSAWEPLLSGRHEISRL